MRSAITLLLTAATLLSAESFPKVGPNFTRPKFDTPPAFTSAGPDAKISNEAALAQWWQSLGDPALNSLIKRALASNLDVKLASRRLLEARAARQISRADLFPTVENSDSVQRIRGGFNQGIIHLNSQGGGSPGIISAFETNAYQAGFDASWEIDLFGGKRRALEASTADVQASNEARHDVLVSVLAEVARDYIELRGAQRRLQLTRENIDLQKDSLHLSEVRAEAGLGNQFDVERQRSQVESTAAVLPQLELTIAQQIHALGVLLAQPPAGLQAELATAAPMPPTPPEVPVGLPSQLLERRPDIRQAEAQVAAATARIGVARADFFPKITLTGSAGRQSADWSGFTLGAGNFFAIGPGVKIPLFTGGRLKANLDVQKQRFEESLLTYQNTVLQGLRETEDSLEQYNRERDRRLHLGASVEASEQATRLSRELYISGLADFLSVLDAQREQLSVETDLAVSDTAALTSLISVYKALGGGWSSVPENR